MIVRMFGVILLTLLVACKQDADSAQNRSQVNADRIGRSMAGDPLEVSSQMFPDDAISSLHGSQRARDWGYQFISRVVVEADLPNGLKIPKWLSFYEKDEIAAMVAAALKSPADLPKGPYGFSDAQIDHILENAKAYDGAVNITNLNKQSGGGFVRETISGQSKGGIFLNGIYVRHILAHFKNVVSGNKSFRMAKFVGKTGGGAGSPATLTTPMVDKIPPFPLGAIAVKVLWHDEGQLAYYNTDSESLSEHMANAKDQWTPAGFVDTNSLENDQIFRIKTRDGKSFVAPAIHFLVKNARPWMWVTMWWHPDPNTDFGRDRPSHLIPDPWRNYKMSVVTAFTETEFPLPKDSPNIFANGSTDRRDPAYQRSAQPFLEYKGLVTFMKNKFSLNENPSWTSNPYLETHQFASNCIGCHGIPSGQPLVPGFEFFKLNFTAAKAPDILVSEDFSFQVEPISIAVQQAIDSSDVKATLARCNVRQTNSQSRVLCPPSFKTEYNYGVNVAAKCTPGGLCERCYGFGDAGGQPGYEKWPHEVERYSDVRVTDPLPLSFECGGHEARGCNFQETDSMGRVLCPIGFSTSFTFAVNVDAACNKGSGRCNRCIGYLKPMYGFPPVPWPQGKVSNIYQGGIRVVEPLDSHELPSQCQQ